MPDLGSCQIIVFGTRPEFIKLLPVIMLIESRGLRSEFVLVYTGQHGNIVEELFDVFKVHPDYTIPFINHSNSILHCFNHISEKLDEIFNSILENKNIKYVIGQGDTTTCTCAAFTAFLNEIPFAHIEAGLRTYDKKNPFPEEYFRRIITESTQIHFAPTQNAFKNLVNENIDKQRIIVTGNTIIDMLKIAQANSDNSKEYEYLKNYEKNVLITCHRRENQNEVIDRLLEEILDLSKTNSNINFLWIGHPNSLDKEILKKISSLPEQKNLNFIPPVSYYNMLRLYPKINLIITDSGGIQEEASFFGVPVIVIRRKTERIESLDMGIAYLQDLDFNNFSKLFNKCIKMPITKYTEIYGDGNASEKILNHLTADSKKISS